MELIPYWVPPIFDLMERKTKPFPTTTSVILILLIGYVLSQLYYLARVLFSLGLDDGSSFIFIPEWLIPEAVGYLVECVVLYCWLTKALRTKVLAFSGTTALVLFSGLLFFAKVTIGSFILKFFYLLLFEYIEPLPVLLGYPLSEDRWSIYMRPVQYAGLAASSTWVCFKCSCWIFRLTQRRKTIENEREEESVLPWPHETMLYIFAAAITAITVFYYLCVSRPQLLTISRLSGDLGNLWAENIFIWIFLILPSLGTYLIFLSGSPVSTLPRRMVFAGGIAGIVCCLLVYAGTRLLIITDVGFPNIGVTVLALSLTYLLCIMGCSWGVRKLVWVDGIRCGEPNDSKTGTEK